MRSRSLLLILCAFYLTHLMPAAAQTTTCGENATLIHDIQGNSTTSPMTDDPVTIEGVVVGDFQLAVVQMRGFFLQEESGDTDSDETTSEGIFVFDRGFGVEVNIGDVVRVDGKVIEFASDGSRLTQISNVTAVTVCESGDALDATPISLPLEDGIDWEQYEGMLVTFPEPLTVTENFDLARYGVVTLSADGRLWQPSNVVAPGTDATDLAATYPDRSIILDDGNLQQNRDPGAYPSPGLSATNTLRNGDTLTGLTGVLDERNGAYRVHPTGDVTFSHDNPRPTSPPNVGGTLTVAAMNVLNYFNGDGQGGGFPTSRGATNAPEFTRQRDKIIHAIAALDADIIGLMELENDEGDNSAIDDLVEGINAEIGSDTYTYVDTGIIGTDEIRVAVIYKPGTVELVGWEVNEEAVFSRPPILATFREIATDEAFSISVNHFKSKGSCPTNPADPNADGGDGQSCWNPLRVSQAEALTDWLADDPTGSGDPDFLIVGDLNAYALEDPITTIEGDGYTNLIAQFVGDEAYSYVFFGQSGYLDHALATGSLTGQVAGAAEWHINADEPRSLDYNVEFKSPGQVTGFYSSDPFRVSDHDPLIVGLNLGQGDATAEPPTEVVPSDTPDADVTAEPSPTEATASDTPAPSDTPDTIATAAPSPTETPEELPPPVDNGGGFFAVIVVIVAALAAMLGLGVRRGR